jgi:hypothetical protein
VSAIADRCASCGGALAERQRWCLACGAAPGVALAATPPGWAARGAVAAVVVLLALAGIGYAVATLISA